VIEASILPPTVLADLDDDHVIACAVSGKVNYVVTGDPHWLRLGKYESIPIITVNDFLEHLKKES
jgi:predicted nucleic acid-binding protein